MRLKQRMPVKIVRKALHFTTIVFQHKFSAHHYGWPSTPLLSPEGQKCSLAGLPAEIQILLASAVQSTGSFSWLYRSQQFRVRVDSESMLGK